MASSHAVKRFIGAISFCRVYLFRRLLQDVFVWRLKHTKPEVIVLGIDTTVLDNDDAKKRHGVQPTYKKVKGFQPLQMNWGRYVQTTRETPDVASELIEQLIRESEAYKLFLTRAKDAVFFLTLAA